MSKATAFLQVVSEYYGDPFLDHSHTMYGNHPSMDHMMGHPMGHPYETHHYMASTPMGYGHKYTPEPKITGTKGSKARAFLAGVGAGGAAAVGTGIGMHLRQVAQAGNLPL